jgi:RNA polymerase sigma-70 factor (ECF subfamily)
MEKNSDSHLLQQAHRYRMSALTAIYDRYNTGLYYYALRLLGDPALSEDCVAEVFRRLLHTLRNGGGPNENLKGYLYRSVHNWITDYYRQNPHPTLALDTETPNPYDNPSEQAEINIAAQNVRAALCTLTPDQHQVIALRFLEGWTLEEVAVSLNKPVGAIKSLQHRALAALQRMLLTEVKVEL